MWLELRTHLYGAVSYMSLFGRTEIYLCTLHIAHCTTALLLATLAAVLRHNHPGFTPKQMMHQYWYYSNERQTSLLFRAHSYFGANMFLCSCVAVPSAIQRNFVVSRCSFPRTCIIYIKLWFCFELDPIWNSDRTVMERRGQHHLYGKLQRNWNRLLSLTYCTS